MNKLSIYSQNLGSKMELDHYQNTGFKQIREMLKQSWSNCTEQGTQIPGVIYNQFYKILYVFCYVLCVQSDRSKIMAENKEKHLGSFRLLKSNTIFIS